MPSSADVSGVLLILTIILCNAREMLSCPPSCVCRNDFMKCLAQTEFPTNIPSHITRILMDEFSVDTIPPRAFKSASKVRLIEFTRCNFGSVSGCAFEDLQLLEQIKFDKCVVGVIDKMAFSNINTPTSISITDSKLTTIQPFGFMNLQNISSLVLSDTTIHNLKKFSFYKISNVIDSFQWIRNTLLDIERHAFTKVGDVGTVLISSNKIETLPCESMDNFVTSSNIVHFDKNLLNCDCGLQWVRPKLASLLAANIIDNTCYAPKVFANKTIVAAASSRRACDNPSKIKLTECKPMAEVRERFVCPTEKAKYPWKKDKPNNSPGNAAKPSLNVFLYFILLVGNLSLL